MFQGHHAKCLSFSQGQYGVSHDWLSFTRGKKLGKGLFSADHIATHNKSGVPLVSKWRGIVVRQANASVIPTKL